LYAGREILEASPKCQGSVAIVRNGDTPVIDRGERWSCICIGICIWREENATLSRVRIGSSYSTIKRKRRDGLTSLAARYNNEAVVNL
jgi:hypothetical protein